MSKIFKNNTHNFYVSFEHFNTGSSFIHELCDPYDFMVPIVDVIIEDKFYVSESKFDKYHIEIEHSNQILSVIITY